MAKVINRWKNCLMAIESSHKRFQKIAFPVMGCRVLFNVAGSL